MLRATMVLLIALVSTSAMAEGSSVGYGMGGRIDRYDPVVAQYNQSGELFRIVGHCQSACTLFLAIRNVCIEPNARLLFHAGFKTWATQHMLDAYNAPLREYLMAHHAMETLAFFAISGRDMIAKFRYRRCPRR